MVLPGRKIHVETARLQLAPLADVVSLAEQLLQAALTIAQIIERKTDAALALIGRIIDRYDQRLFAGALPCKGQETIPRPVPIPSGFALEEFPSTITSDRLAQHGEQSIVELRESFVDRLLGSTHQMRRNAPGFSHELSLVKEPRPGRQ